MVDYDKSGKVTPFVNDELVFEDKDIEAARSQNRELVKRQHEIDKRCR